MRAPEPPQGKWEDVLKVINRRLIMQWVDGIKRWGTRGVVNRVDGVAWYDCMGKSVEGVRSCITGLVPPPQRCHGHARTFWFIILLLATSKGLIATVEMNPAVSDAATCSGRPPVTIPVRTSRCLISSYLRVAVPYNT